MIIRLRNIAILSVLVLLPTATLAQDDETRQGTGLPTLVGENSARGGRMNVSGRIVLDGLDRSKRLPVIRVYARAQGSNVDNAVTNDAGYYVLRNVPRESMTIVVEVDGVEVASQFLVPSPMSNSRMDVTIPWPMASSSRASVIAAPAFARTEANEALFQSAVTAVKAKQIKKAIEVFNKILEATPQDFVAWTELGTLYFNEEKLDNAEAAYFKAIELQKDFLPALMNLGKLYIAKKKYDDAVLVLSNAVKISPTSADAHHFLGESYLQVKKGSLAVVVLNEAIRLDPQGKADLHLRLATLFDAATLKSRAASEYKLFLAKRPDYKEKSALEKYISQNADK